MIYLYLLCCLIPPALVLTFFIFRKRKTAPPRMLPVLTEWDRQHMAFHEAGHAVCSRYLPEREKLLLITIDPTSEAFGMIHTEQRPHHNETRTSFSSTISTFLAGRLSEEMFLNSMTSSCIHDLAAAQQIAEDMVMNFGMGQTLGLSAPGKIDAAYLGNAHKEMICSDIQQIIKDAEKDARLILTAHGSEVRSLAEMLLERKTLHSDEIEAFFDSAAGSGGIE